ncbi:hypothetical protein ACS3SW_20985 [Roseobacteraceae bacterium S113]
MKLILHIGTPKTASTLIQNSFATNRKWLLKRGIAYGKLMAPDANHITLFYACARDVHDFARTYGLHSREDLVTFRKRLTQRITGQLRRLPPHVDTMVMSSENLSGNLRHVEEIQNLRTMLQDRFDEIKIVVYVRRQDDAMLSMWGEFMRRGFSDDPFRRFVDTCLGPNSPTPYLYYRRELSKWIEVWGKPALIVRRYARHDFINGDILSDFMGVVQGTWEPDMMGFSPSPENNSGLSAPALEFLRQLHPHIPFIKDGAPNHQRIRLTRAINQLDHQPRPVMAAATARHIMAHFETANTWLKQAFFPGLSGPFFPDRPEHPEHGNLGIISPEQSRALTGQLLARLPIAPA